MTHCRWDRPDRRRDDHASPAGQRYLPRGRQSRRVGPTSDFPGGRLCGRPRATSTGRGAPRRPRAAREPARPRRGGGAPHDRLRERGRRPATGGPRHGHRPVHAARADRRRRHGHRLPGRAGRAAPPTRGAEGHQAGDGLRSSPGPLRGRAAGSRADGPPQHRQGPRRRHDFRRPPLLRHGAGRGHPDHPLLRRVPAHARSAAGVVHPRLPGDPARRTRKALSTAISSRPTSW